MLDTEKMRVELRKLGGVLDADISASYEGGDTYKNSFEEYMREHEFGLALEVICDYLAADGSKFIDSVKMTLIEELHNAMQIQDDCISRLESAWSQARPSPR
jgi:predicted Zn-dependent protease with MMP-like domain